MSDDVKRAIEDADRIKSAGMIYASMAKIMRDCKAIEKGQTNRDQGYRFRGIDDAYNTLHSIVSEHGVFTTSEVVECEMSTTQSRNGKTTHIAKVHVRYTFWALDGSSVTSEIVGVGFDLSDKAANKAQAVAHKYALLQAFLVPTSEPKDPENESIETPPSSTGGQRTRPRTVNGKISPEYQREHGLIGKSQIDELTKELQHRGVSPGDWSSWLKQTHGCEKAIDIPLEKYDAILSAVRSGEIDLPF